MRKLIFAVAIAMATAVGGRYPPSPPGVLALKPPERP